MPKISKQMTGVIIVAFALAVMVAGQYFLAPKTAAFDPVAARSKGEPQAKVKITEFIDFQCPACAAGSKILKDQFEAHPKDIYLQIKYFPLPSVHRHAMESALYSECAARQGKFWAVHEQMMPQQAQWSQLLSADPIFQIMAKEAGTDMARLNACLASDEARKAVNDERSMGQSMGVKSTPSYFINGKMLVGTKSLKEELQTYFPEEQ